MAPDLAESIVALGKASQARTSARRSLEESATIVAGAITKQLRRGDTVGVTEALNKAAKVPYTVQRFQAPPSGAQVQPRYVELLVRSDAVLDSRFSQPVLESPDLPGMRFHVATAQEFMFFVVEATAVADAFRDLLETEGRTFEAAAWSVTRRVVR